MGEPGACAGGTCCDKQKGFCVESSEEEALEVEGWEECIACNTMSCTLSHHLHCMPPNFLHLVLPKEVFTYMEK